MSFDAANVLRELPEVTGIIKGEGEETFARLAGYYVDKWCEKGTDSGKSLPTYNPVWKIYPGLLFAFPMVHWQIPVSARSWI